MSYIITQQLVQPDTTAWEGEWFQEEGLLCLIGASHNALIGHPDTALDEESGEYVRVELDIKRLHDLLPDGRGSAYKNRIERGWTYAEIAEIVQLLREKVDQMRRDAAALQANPVEVVNLLYPWGDTLVVVGDVNLLKAADEVEELVNKWRGGAEV